ncbi:MAG TPA: transposase [Steroidobacteraceae bacterium]|jgi:REP element-mobilizing transposase RayT
MTYARKSLISLQETPYYHVVARCVRRAWLWGVDDYARKDYSHRKTWVLERLEQLASMFAVDICAYAVMSNHYHLVLHVDQVRVKEWTQQEIIDRWTRLFARPILIERWQQGLCVQGERAAAEHLIELWRGRLCDVSWYMRCLNEYLARRANAEDGCKGRFWEGRFKSQALLDEAGLLTAMAYVDLNPIRAGIAATPEQSEFTSIHARIEELRRSSTPSKTPSESSTDVRVALLDFHDTVPVGRPSIPFSLRDYLALVDWTGRVRRENKRGAISEQLPAIMHRLRIDADAWNLAMRPQGNRFGRALGRLDHLRLHASRLGQSWIRGLRQAGQLYRSG